MIIIKYIKKKSIFPIISIIYNYCYPKNEGGEIMAEDLYCLVDKNEDYDCWISVCGHYIEDGFHCPFCGQEPPWGCPCFQCEEPEPDPDYFYDDAFYG